MTMFATSLMLLAALAAQPAVATPAAPKTELSTVTFESTAPYMVVLPAGYDAIKKYPLVLMLHGLGSSLKDFASYMPMLNQTDYIYVLAQGPFPYLLDEKSVGYAWSLWQDEALMIRMGEESLRYLQGVVDKVMAAYPIAQGQVYAFGHSQGGLMCYMLMLMPSHTGLNGVIISGGFLDDSLLPMLKNCEHIPVLALHGTKDEVIPYKDAVELNKKLVELGFAAQLVSYPVGHTLTQEMLYDMDDFIARRWLADLQSGSTPMMIKALDGDEKAMEIISTGTLSGDPATRMKAIELLGFLPMAPAELELKIRKGFERNASTEEMIAYCRAAAAAKVPATVDQLAKLAKDKGRSAELREAALSALRRMHLPEADAAVAEIPTCWKVTWVDPALQAAKLGIQTDDIILSAAGTEIKSSDNLRKVLSDNEGKPVELVIQRGNQQLKITATGGRLGVRLMETPA
jgi:phospholipase/carboxylesterase